MLNALVWIAGAEVPTEGVPSPTPTVKELEADQDYDKKRNWQPEKIRQMIERWNRQ
jgi:hypothetical protein